MSPDFQYGMCQKMFEGRTFLTLKHVGDDTPARGNLLKLREVKNWDTDEIIVFFTRDNKYCGMKKQNLDYDLFRTYDGHFVGILDHRHIELAFSFGMGGFLVVVGIIDILTGKCAPWCIKALLNFSEGGLMLNKNDIEKGKNEEEHDEPMILGLPMPALFPLLLHRFRKSDLESQR